MDLIKKLHVLFLLFWVSGSCCEIYSQGNYPVSSVLSAGQWFKIAVKEEGIYRIDYSKLRQLGLENPSNPRIFGNNQGQLSYYNDNSASDDLKEIPVMFVKGIDGIFSEGDYLLFYAMGTNRWKYDPEIQGYDFILHNYSDSAYYFITSSPQPGKQISSASTVTDAPTYYSSSYDALYIHELETENLIGSGREWYQPISTISPVEIDPGFSNIITTEKVKYDIRVLGRSSSPTTFGFYQGSDNLETIVVPESQLVINNRTLRV